ncbi:hypothetical protein J0895_05500 [Phormidium pseudopriestleyi FRX01]|uniref:Uncharacterized protein n=1 Tax=Phormidium pseudopriestleyi FRX01 TaxID=1759528 RepID=A0ABS3FN79_9CYAN|nr:hypothetical protein [Phormidium pseudopriestleyi]MBO0348570.1 hypothetical protein [Phormidium pseudopriestleyi FRX01]
MNYLVAVLSDRIQAETAYSVLEAEGFPLNQVSILGRGYKSADEYGLIDPNEQAIKQSKLMATWLIPFGFVAGIIFSVISGLQTFSWAGEIGNHVVGGFCGAVAGAMGSFFVGGGAGVAFGSGDALPYRNRLNRGKYLVVVNGSPRAINQASLILRKLDLEGLQSYLEE